MITRYYPSCAASSGYADASVCDLLDMRSGVVFSESYLDPDADVRLLEQVMGWAPDVRMTCRRRSTTISSG